MRWHTIRAALWIWMSGCYVGAFGHPNGLPVKSAGAPGDGGRDCSVCHGSANSDPRGSIRIDAGDRYVPGQSQKIRVTLSYPVQGTWSFQMTARALNAPANEAGAFVPNPDVRVYCGPDGVTQAPCQGATEYAVNANPASAQGSRTWEMDWMPPLSENGKIRFYVSAVAGNNNGAPGGDATFTGAADVAFGGACPLTPPASTVQIQAVENAGSFTAGPAGFNSLITLKGLNFAEPATGRVAGPGDLDENGRYPTTLACLAVEMLRNGQSIGRLPLTFVSKDQINSQAPSLEDGTIDLRVIRNPDKDNQIKSLAWTGVPISSYSPAFFTFNGRSIAAQLSPNYDILARPEVVPGGRLALPGDIVILYGTGFGVTTPVWRAGEVPTGQAPLRDPYTITVGGITLGPDDILYGGLAPGLISGVYQFNIRLPNSVPGGDVPVSIRIGGAQTQDGVTIPVNRP